MFSISGKDTRFPPLYGTGASFEKGYNIMHPNCRHEFIPFVEQMQSPEKLKEIIKDSNDIKEYSKDDKMFDLYKRGQAQHRQWVDESKEYHSLKAKLGDDMPYKTLRDFRRARRQGSLQYKQLHYHDRDKKQFEGYKEFANKVNLPKTLEKFQEIKYTNNEEYNNILKQIRKAKSNKPFENNLQPRSHVDIPSGETKERYVAKELGVGIERAKDYVESLRIYTDDDYSIIREYQQGKTVNNEKFIKYIADNIEEYIKKAPRYNGGETFRGVGLTDEQLKTFTVGSEHDMLGMSSWSTKKENAEFFANKNSQFSIDKKPAVFHCDTQDKGTSVKHLSKYKSEDEILVSKDSRYNVLRVREIDCITHIYLEEI